MFFKPSGRLIAVRPDNPKAHSPIDLTVEGNVTDVRLEHPEKALAPIVSNPSGRVTLVSFVQLSKAPSPTSLTPAGRVISVNFVEARIHSGTMVMLAGKSLIFA